MRIPILLYNRIGIQYLRIQLTILFCSSRFARI